MNVAGSPEKENAEKSSLEIQKLTLEITHLRSRWYLPALIQATPATIVVIATVCIAWSTGLLDAKREHLAANTERLQVEKLFLQQEEKNIRGQLASLTEQLSNSQTELNAFKAEEQAIGHIRAVWPSSTVEYLLGEYGFRIKLVGSRFKVVTITEGPSGPIESKMDDDPQATLDVIKSICTMRNVRDLAIEDIPLTYEALESLGQLSSLTTLRLVRNELSNEIMKGFPKFPELTFLDLYVQPFTIADNLNSCSHLEELKFYHV